MQFTIKDLKTLISSVITNKVEHIYIKSKNLQITINTVKYTQKKFPNSTTIINQTTKQNTNIAFKSKTKNKINLKSPITDIDNNSDTYFTIISPMIGTFYRSPAPNEPPFIDINDQVISNQTVCIIEAMKLMNEIQSEIGGQIVEILVEDGDIVDCGQALMRVKTK